MRNLIRQAAGAFAVDILAYAVMSNATRWASAHPRTAPEGTPQTWKPQRDC